MNKKLSLPLHMKRSFPLWISLVNVNKSAENFGSSFENENLRSSYLRVS